MAVQSTVLSVRSSTTDRSFPFLRLPGELRNKVYRYMLLSKHVKYDVFNTRDLEGLTFGPTVPKHNFYRFYPEILRVNHQIYHEAREILDNENVFVSFSMTWKSPMLRRYEFPGTVLEFPGLHILAEDEEKSLRLPPRSVRIHLGNNIRNDRRDSELKTRTVLFASEEMDNFGTSLLLHEATIHGFLELGFLSVNFFDLHWKGRKMNGADLNHPQSVVSRILNPLRCLHGLKSMWVWGIGSAPEIDAITRDACKVKPNFETMRSQLYRSFEFAEDAFDDHQYSSALALYQDCLQECRRLHCYRDDPGDLHISPGHPVSDTDLTEHTMLCLLQSRVGMVYSELGDIGEAYDWLEVAIGHFDVLNARDPSGRVHRVNAILAQRVIAMAAATGEKLRRPELAIDALKQGIKMYPKNATFERELCRLQNVPGQSDLNDMLEKARL